MFEKNCHAFLLKKSYKNKTIDSKKSIKTSEKYFFDEIFS